MRMERLHCPICGKKILDTIRVANDPQMASGAACKNEYGYHVGLFYYKFIDVQEMIRETSDTSNLILN